jgi:alkylation response protein AidB-like acyl-CoA dehydrogenase
VRECIEVADGRTVLDPADLRLGESEPGAEQFLGDAVAPVACREFAVPAVCTDNATDVLGGERVAERRSVPEGGGHGWRPGCAVDRLYAIYLRKLRLGRRSPRSTRGTNQIQRMVMARQLLKG